MSSSSWSAECWLATLAVFQLMALSLTYFSSLIVIMLPFAVMGFVAVFVAIYLKWKRGIYIFIVFSLILLVFAAVPFFHICFVEKKAATKPHRVVIYLFQMILQCMCIFYGFVVINHDATDKPEPADEEESQGLLGRIKGMFGSKPNPEAGGV